MFKNQDIASPPPDLPILQQLGDTPRHVPLTTRLYLRMFSGGWFLAVFGFMFALVGAFLGIGDAIPRDWVDAGKGTITNVKKSGSIGGDNTGGGGQPIFAYHFETTRDDGEKITRISKRASNITGPTAKPQCAVGDEVALEQAGKHYRIKGMTITGILWWFPLTFLCVGLLFGFSGLCYAIYSWFARGKAICLLQDGTVVAAKYVGMTPTRTQVNEQPIMNVNFEYWVDGAPYVASVCTEDTSRLTDGKYKAVLYDPMEPKQSIVWDGLPCGVRLDEMTGQFYVHPLRLVLPLLAASIVCAQIAAIVVLVVSAI